jgi:hypothetical protein
LKQSAWNATRKRRNPLNLTLWQKNKPQSNGNGARLKDRSKDMGRYGFKENQSLGIVAPTKGISKRR